MNRNRILASTTLAIALGIGALAPTIVSADPVISADGTDLDHADGTAEIGRTTLISGTGCVAPGEAQTYAGVYFRIPSIQGLEDWHKGVEVPATNGEFTWTGDSEGFSPIDIEFTFFCSTTEMPDQGLNTADPALLWASAPYTRSYYEAAPNRATSLKVTGSPAGTAVVSQDRTSSASSDEPTMQVDPESLPVVDRIGITRTPAANLKARVDANAGDVAKTENFFRAFYGRTPTDEELSLNVKRFATKSDLTVANSLASKSEFSYRGNWAAAVNTTLATATSDSYTASHADQNYVIASFYTLAGRTPTASELSQYTAQLAGGLPKVQVVENIALKANNASYWNAKALKK